MKKRRHQLGPRKKRTNHQENLPNTHVRGRGGGISEDLHPPWGLVLREKNTKAKIFQGAQKDVISRGGTALSYQNDGLVGPPWEHRAKKRKRRGKSIREKL